MELNYCVKEPSHITEFVLKNTENKPWYEHSQSDKNRWISDFTYKKIKRAIDIIFCLVAIPLFLPILAICCLAVVISSPGPIFFLQERTGTGGRRFKMYKLRTMVKNADELKQKYMHLNLLTYPDFKIPNDPRITKIGYFLRKTSLDELPQFMNVMKGDMSIVGPRPTSFSASTYRLWHTARLQAKPGMTGLWQVSGRNKLDFDDRVRLDISYQRNQCLKLDLQILLRTYGAVVHRHGAN